MNDTRGNRIFTDDLIAIGVSDRYSPLRVIRVNEIGTYEDFYGNETPRLRGIYQVTDAFHPVRPQSPWFSNPESMVIIEKAPF